MHEHQKCALTGVCEVWYAMTRHHYQNLTFSCCVSVPVPVPVLVSVPVPVLVPMLILPVLCDSGDLWMSMCQSQYRWRVPVLLLRGCQCYMLVFRVSVSMLRVSVSGHNQRLLSLPLTLPAGDGPAVGRPAVVRP